MGGVATMVEKVGAVDGAQAEAGTEGVLKSQIFLVLLSRGTEMMPKKTDTTERALSLQVRNP